MATDKIPPVVKDTLALTLLAEAHPEATLPQIIKASLTAARLARCSIRSTWNNGKRKVSVLVHAEDTYQGAQRRVQRELEA